MMYQQWTFSWLPAMYAMYSLLAYAQLVAHIKPHCMSTQLATPSPAEIYIRQTYRQSANALQQSEMVYIPYQQMLRHVTGNVPYTS